ncbi:RNA-binding protein 48 isoform X3 [Phalaenopsis equestris]|uniref:RNA-binding protein 48 isoform X3 n=1 Tax=Phalaenopsis equestris TaxID=78828 RepID=UPI0009E47A81|nr:RNA-binding protein 48 isoform X3 [Phalaenopsis equestris]
MPRNRDDPPAIRVYTICDESKYLIVRNVPALGCGEELSKLFGSYGEIVEFAKRKLDESIFLGNRLQISYAPDFESLSDTRDKLERRRIEVLSRIKFPRPDGSKSHITTRRCEDEKHYREHPNQVSSNQDYFPSASMNETVRLVRSKLDKVQSSSEHIANPPALKKIRMDNRRRI